LQIRKISWRQTKFSDHGEHRARDGRGHAPRQELRRWFIGSARSVGELQAALAGLNAARHFFKGATDQRFACTCKFKFKRDECPDGVILVRSGWLRCAPRTRRIKRRAQGAVHNAILVGIASIMPNAHDPSAHTQHHGRTVDVGRRGNGGSSAASIQPCAGGKERRHRIGRVGQGVLAALPDHRTCGNHARKPEASTDESENHGFD
jgi:hypothetical protein